MEHIQPWFYSQFHCIAGQCTDTCCAGWEICIDPESLARYKADGSDFGLYRQSKIVQTQEGASFALDDQGRCPFLNDENLCTMMLQDGAASLCHICTHHPRFYNTYGVYDEQGIGLCCPEGSRLLLSAPLRFQRRRVLCDTPPDAMAETIFELRGLLQEILLDTTMAFAERCEEALAVANQAQAQLYGQSQMQQAAVDKLALWQTLLEHMMALLPINPAWQGYLEGLCQQLPSLVEAEERFCQSRDYDGQDYGNIAAYILYRQFSEVLEKGDIVAQVCFALRSTLFVHLCYVWAWQTQGSLTLDDKVYHLKNWSKQVEYCQENAQAFLASGAEPPINGIFC